MATIPLSCNGCRDSVGTLTVPDVIPAFTPPAPEPPPLPTDPFLVKLATQLALCKACAAVAKSKRTH